MASGAVGVSGFLVKNSIFLFNNAAKMRLCPDSAKSESGPGYKAAGPAKSNLLQGNDGASAAGCGNTVPGPQCSSPLEMWHRPDLS